MSTSACLVSRPPIAMTRRGRAVVGEGEHRLEVVVATEQRVVVVEGGLAVLACEPIAQRPVWLRRADQLCVRELDEVLQVAPHVVVGQAEHADANLGSHYLI